MDPLMGIVGALVITKWSFGLLSQTGSLLLDKQAPLQLRDTILKKIEDGQDRTFVFDLHMWLIGPGIYNATLIVVSDQEKTPLFYKDLLSDMKQVVHVTVEVHQMKANFPDYRSPAAAVRN